MKRIISLFAAITLIAVGAAAQPKIVFAENTHDFGSIKEADGPASYEFSFKNDGDTPLVIYSAWAQCGCTTPDYPKKPIEPGKEAVIKVTYNPKGRPGEFTKTVEIKTNDKANKKVKLKITGVVVPK